MKKLKSIILAFTFFAFSSTSLFPSLTMMIPSGGSSSSNRGQYYCNNDVVNKAIKGAALGALSGAMIIAAIISDKFYRENNKDFNNTFKVYLALDAFDSFFKAKSISALSGFVLIYDVFLFFKKKNENLSEGVQDSDKDIEIDVSGAVEELVDVEIGGGVNKRLQISLITLKNSLFVLDGISSVLQNLLDDKPQKSTWTNIGTAAKILARSIDTKNCRIVKKGLLLSLIPALNGVSLYKYYGNRGYEEYDNSKNDFFSALKKGFCASYNQKWYGLPVGSVPIEVQKEFTYYDVLGVNGNSNANDIGESYRRLIKQAHPDKGGTPDAFKSLKTAYNCLSNHDSRRNYNNWLNSNNDYSLYQFHELMTSDAIKFFETLHKK